MKRPSAAEGGFTIIEVIVAVFVLMMAALATFGLLSAATKNTERAKATQVALDRAQQEIEVLHSLTNEKLALTEWPPPSSDALNPNHRVLNNTFALIREPMESYRPLVVNGGERYGESAKISGGVVDPGPIAFTSGGVSGKVYRYIVWRNDKRCSETKCPGPQDYKQIVVAVKLDTPGGQAGERGYVEVQSDFVDPIKSPVTDPVPGEEGVVTPQQFFLTDTPCAKAPPTVRQEITKDHLLHNTLGTCASGLQNEATLGAPDALLLGQPPPPENGSEVPLYDYSEDCYLEPSPDTDKGLQLLNGEAAGCVYVNEGAKGCNYVPTGRHPEARVHRWVTDPMKANFTMTGKVTLEFYTRTLDDLENTKGKLCVYLFKRHEKEEAGELKAEDKRLTNAKVGSKPEYWTFIPENNAFWPRLKWESERLTMEFNEAPYTIPAKDRLGVALSVEREGTGAEAIPIMYDHPSYPTRIEVDTSTPIEGG
jgi:type II secretory pathway pseudopilin PulG